MVGTSKTYQGKEIESQNDSKIGGLSPGPAYYPKTAGDVGHDKNRPKYSFGGVRVELDKRISPGPANYESASFPALGPQRINSDFASKPRWGMGSSTRDHMERVHLDKSLVSNLSSHALLGKHFSAAHDAMEAKLRAEREARLEATATVSSSALQTFGNSGPVRDPARSSLGRALRLAVVAGRAEPEDPQLAEALMKLRARVAVLARANTTTSA